MRTFADMIAHRLAPDIFDDAARFHRLSSEVEHYQRWLAEFPQVQAVLQRLLIIAADGAQGTSTSDFREQLRRTSVKTYTNAEQALERIALLDEADGHELTVKHAHEAVAIACKALGKHPSQIRSAFSEHMRKRSDADGGPVDVSPRAPSWHYDYLQEEIRRKGGAVDEEDGSVWWPDEHPERFAAPPSAAAAPTLVAWEDIAHLFCSCGKDHCNAAEHAPDYGLSADSYAKRYGCQSPEAYELAQRVAAWINKREAALNVPDAGKPKRQPDALEELVRRAVAAFDTLTPAQKEAHLQAQRRSWVIGNMLLDHPEMTREQVEAIFERVNQRGT